VFAWVADAQGSSAARLEFDDAVKGWCHPSLRQRLPWQDADLSKISA